MFEKLASVALAAIARLKTAHQPEVEPVSEISQNGVPELGLVYPGDNCCQVWYYDSWRGHTQNFCLPEGSNQVDHYLGQLSGHAGSYSCGQNVAYDFCRGDLNNCDYDRGLKGAGAGHAYNAEFWWDITHLRLYKYDQDERGAVTLFSDGKCNCRAGRFYADEDPSVAAWYTRDAMYQNNMPWDDADSAWIPYGYTLTLFDGATFDGFSRQFVGPVWDQSTRKQRCISLGDITNKAASLKIERNAIVGAAHGYWKSITASETISFVTSYGMDYSTSQAQHWEQEYNLSYSMEENVMFYIFSSGFSMSESYRSMVSKDVQATFGYSISNEVTLTCTMGEGYNVGLWQWVVETRSGQSSTKTLHTVCRYGDGLYNVPPACPWNACIDAQCTKCSTDWKA